MAGDRSSFTETVADLSVVVVPLHFLISTFLLMAGRGRSKVPCSLTRSVTYFNLLSRKWNGYTEVGAVGALKAGIMSITPSLYLFIFFKLKHLSRCHRWLHVRG